MAACTRNVLYLMHTSTRTETKAASPAGYLTEFLFKDALEIKFDPTKHTDQVEFDRQRDLLLAWRRHLLAKTTLSAQVRGRIDIEDMRWFVWGNVHRASNLHGRFGKEFSFMSWCFPIFFPC
jgi:hypothetical protein